jgi:hypothetical protein
MRKRIIFSAAALILSAGAGVAATSDIASHQRADFYAPGKHQFYAWCADGQDRLLAQSGFSARDAETKVFASQKMANACRLAWQGRIHS